jgi:hypothetical protein
LYDIWHLLGDEGEVPIKRDGAAGETAAAEEDAAPKSNLPPPYKLVLHYNQAGESRLASRTASMPRGGEVLHCHFHDFNPVNITSAHGPQIPRPL